MRETQPTSVWRTTNGAARSVEKRSDNYKILTKNLNRRNLEVPWVPRTDLNANFPEIGQLTLRKGKRREATIKAHQAPGGCEKVGCSAAEAAIMNHQLGRRLLKPFRIAAWRKYQFAYGSSKL
jgi:hypothetical protein